MRDVLTYDRLLNIGWHVIECWILNMQSFHTLTLANFIYYLNLSIFIIYIYLYLLILIYYITYIVINNSMYYHNLITFLFSLCWARYEKSWNRAEVVHEDWNMPLKFRRLYRWIQREKFETGSACPWHFRDFYQFLAVCQPILAETTFKWFGFLFTQDFLRCCQSLLCDRMFSFLFLQLIGYANLCYASERSEVDPVNKQMILRTHNVSICTLFENGLRNRCAFSMHKRDRAIYDTFFASFWNSYILFERNIASMLLCLICHL